MKPDESTTPKRKLAPGANRRAIGAAKSPRSSLRRETILRCATELFDRQGFSNTSLDDIAQAVGVTREALYYYYRNRSEILLAIIEPQSAALIEGLQAIVKAPSPANEKLRMAIQNHLQRFDRHCLEMTISLRDGLLNTNDPVRKSMVRTWKRYERLWRALITEGQISGEFERIGDARMIAFGILGMCNWLARWYDPRKQVAIDEIIETYFKLVSLGVVSRSSLLPTSNDAFPPP